MRKLSIFMLASILSVGAIAQTLIPKVGGTLANFSLSEDVKSNLFDLDPKMKFGFQVGVAYELAISESFAIQPELLYVQKGTMFEESGDKATFNLNYLELPVMFKYKVSNFYFAAGPYLGYGLGGKLKFEESGSPEVSYNIKFGDEPNSNQDDLYLDNALDFGFQIGAGILIIEKIVIDVRYGYGLSNLIDDEDGFDVKWQNRTIQLTVGYPISFN